MIPPLDPSHAPESALSHEEPGFYLVDDAGGRFIVDRQWGIVSVANDDVLAREPGAVHGVMLRVIEPSGASYQLPMQLRLTGREHPLGAPAHVHRSHGRAGEVLAGDDDGHEPDLARRLRCVKCPHRGWQPAKLRALCSNAS